jgi:hypothetical protein
MNRILSLMVAASLLTACEDGTGPADRADRERLSAASKAPRQTAAEPVPFDPEPGPFANLVNLGDDETSGPLPIGFDFGFFGNTFSQFTISSNGFIGFDPLMPNGCCIGRDIPSPDGIDNIIAVAWTDLFPPGGGQISFETRGAAPRRRLIVSFDSLGWYPEFETNRVTAQVILFEGTDVIEIHTSYQSSGHIYTQGVENADGTEAAYIPGRVAADFGLVEDAVRFTTGTPKSRGGGKRVAELVTGSGNFRIDGRLRTFAFTARRHGEGSVRGEWQLLNRALGAKAHGNITCVTVVGNQAWLGGTTERIGGGTGGEVGWRIVDNGSGATAPADQISLAFVGREPGFAADYCATAPLEPGLFDVEAGNLQIRSRSSKRQ